MAYRKWQKKKISLSIEELTKQSEGIVGVDNVNRTNLGRTRIESLKACGTTLVNLLGKYGNFEVDSNADGLADGWALAGNANGIKSLVGGIIGSKAQKIVYQQSIADTTNRAESIYRSIFGDFNGQTFFFSAYIKKDADSTSGIRFSLAAYNGASYLGATIAATETEITTSWQRFCGVFTVPSTSTYIRHSIGYTTIGSTEEKASFYVDGFFSINLTAHGALDPVRQAKYGVINWADLTEEQLESEISYFDSVMSVNVEDGTASELTVENRGKNLIDLFNCTQNSGSVYRTFVSGATRNDNIISISFSDRYIWFYTKIKRNTIYTISVTGEFLSGSRNLIYVRTVNDPEITNPQSGNSLLNDINSLGSFSKTYSYTTGAEYDYLAIGVGGYTGSVMINSLQIEEGSVATDYVPPRTDSITIPSTCELHGSAGVFNHIDSNGNYVKNWERADKTTDASGAFTLSGYATDSKVICRNKTNGEVEILNAANSVATSWASANIEILYRLATAVSSSVAIRGALGDLHRGHNNFICSTQTRESFTGDGYTTVFNTTITPKSVKVNGLAQTSGVTLGASSVTFTTAPRRKAIIEVFGVGTGGALPAIDLKVLGASGTVETVPALVDLSVTENEEKTGYLNVNGAPLKVAGNKTYTVTLNKDLIESQNNILEEYRDKKFRLKVENPRDSSTEYLGVCHIDPDASLDYLNGTESINIKCGDLYD